MRHSGLLELGRRKQKPAIEFGALHGICGRRALSRYFSARYITMATGIRSAPGRHSTSTGTLPVGVELGEIRVAGFLPDEIDGNRLEVDRPAPGASSVRGSIGRGQNRRVLISTSGGWRGPRIEGRHPKDARAHRIPTDFDDFVCRRRNRHPGGARPAFVARRLAS